MCPTTEVKNLKSTIDENEKANKEDNRANNSITL